MRPRPPLPPPGPKGAKKRPALAERSPVFLVCKELDPVNTVLAAPGIADADLAQAAVQDIGPVPRGIHPAVYNGGRCRLASRNVLRRPPVRDAIFPQDCKAAASRGSYIGQRFEGPFPSWETRYQKERPVLDGALSFLFLRVNSRNFAVKQGFFTVIWQPWRPRSP